MRPYAALFAARDTRPTFVNPWIGRLVLCGLAILCLFGPDARAQIQNIPPGVNVRTSRITKHATFVTAVGGGPIPVQPAKAAPPGAAPSPPDFLAQHGHLFGVTDAARQLVARKTQIDGLGQIHETYAQIHKGIPVFSGMLKLHRNARGQFLAANGDFYTIPDKLSTQPRLTAAQAKAAALAGLGRDILAVASSELVIVDPGWYGDRSRGARLAYHIVVSSQAAGLREAFFINAHSGEVLDRWSLVHNARNRLVHNGNAGPVVPGTLIRSEGGPAVALVDANRAYDYAGDVYDYFFRGFARDSIDGAGLPLSITVNSTAPSPCPNAYWDSEQMVFCSGTVTDDIMAHELAHGVTENTANLIYQNQPGQLNESFSDVFGELMDLFNGNAAFAGPPAGPPNWPVHPTGAGQDTPNGLRSAACSPASTYPGGVRWLIGEDATAFGGAIRDMWSPTCFNHPDRANSSLQTCNPFDSGGVHSGSGVPNHAFAILTDGKTFNGQTVTGIGPIKAGAVWYRALTQYLTVTSDFEDAYAAMNQAALDLVGTFPIDPRTGLASASQFTAFDAQQVDKALIAVEMNTPGACGAVTEVLDSDPPDQCAGRVAVFEDDFEGGINGWTVSNSGPPTPYNWAQTTVPLPFGMPGVAWFCPDPDLGNCSSVDESATHSLVSPVIAIPANANRPTLAFTHYLATEAGYDGGLVRIRVNGGDWQPVPPSAFLYNPFNITMEPAPGNTNPIAGQPAWSGVGGEWGTSLINLNGLVSSGDTLQVEFLFGKDGCTGEDGWYIADVEIYTCPCSVDADCDDGDACTDNVCNGSVCSFTPGQDCDGNGTADGCDPDCDNNEIPDGCDLSCAGNCAVCYPGACGTAIDCQLDETPDACQLAGDSGVTVVLHDNGPLVTHPGAGFGGANASAVPTSIFGTSLGYNHDVLDNARVADDFTVPPGGWFIERMTFFAYQTGSSTTSTMTTVNLRIWDGPPNAGGAVVFGDSATNRLTASTFSSIYRVTESTLTNSTRPIMVNTVQVGVHLGEGTYWVDWRTAGTLVSGPWAPPVTRAGLPGTGNALNFEGGVWQPANDLFWRDDFPFIIEGQQTIPDGNDKNGNSVPDECDVPPAVAGAVSRRTHGAQGDFDIPLGIAPATGAVECRSNGPMHIVVTFDQSIAPADGSLDSGDEVVVSSTPPASINLSNLTVAGDELAFDLSGVPNRSCLEVTLHGIALPGLPALVMPDALLRQEVAWGDATDNGKVTTADLNLAKSAVGPAGAGNFRSDVNADGAVDTLDINLIRAATTTLPVSCP